MYATDSTDLSGSANLKFPIRARSNLKPRPTQNKWINKVVRKFKRSGFDQ